MIESKGISKNHVQSQAKGFEVIPFTIVKMCIVSVMLSAFLHRGK